MLINGVFEMIQIYTKTHHFKKILGGGERKHISWPPPKSWLRRCI